MRKILIAGALAACAVPSAALAGETPNPKSPANQCRAERTAMGDTNFKNAYGTNANKSNAFGKCVAKHTASQGKNKANAARACRAERSDPNFAATHGGKTFDQFYGNSKGRAAFGRCVKSKADQATAAQQQARVNASRTCRAEQKTDPAAFKQKYGTNANKSNAFGKCVSAEARKQS